ncbi:MAG: hypothetical protein H0X29_02000 [Parachlamydiaceae bacterium]|nr:hypothetical protein [Parachlamydiaceae bacterium]
MNSYDTCAASTLRIGCFAAHAAYMAIPGYTLLTASKAAVLGGYYVVSRLSTSWLGNKVVSKLVEITGVANTEKNRNRALAITTILNACLFLPSVLIACKLAAFSGVAVFTFKAATVLALKAVATSVLLRGLMSCVLEKRTLTDVLPTALISENVLSAKYLAA